MRTTLTIDDSIAEELKEMAHRSGAPFKQVVNEALRAGLISLKTPAKVKPHKFKPVALGEPRAEYDLDKALSVSNVLEDAEIVRKLNLKK